MEPAPLSHRLAELATAFGDETITSEQFAELEQLLTKDASARRAYIRFMGEHGCLLSIAAGNELLAQSSADEARLAPILDAALRDEFAPAGSGDLLAEDTQRQLSLPDTRSALDGRSRAQSFVVTSLGAAFRRLPQPVLWSTALVALVSYGIFAIIAWDLRPEVARRSADQAIESVRMPTAKLTTAHDCRWESGLPSPAAGEELPFGELSLVSGLAEITFEGGAKVVFQGPAQFEPRDKSHVYLRAGSLAAHVPPRAVGFEVETPTARVVDLGTDFRLDASPQETKLAVTKGAVDVMPIRSAATAASRTPRRTFRVTAGQAATVTRTSTTDVVVARSTFDAEWVQRSARLGEATARFTSVGPIKGVTATASSFFSVDDRAPIHAVDGSGLFLGDPSGFGHDIRPVVNNVGTMWLSTTTTLGPLDPDPWLIIDLGKVYQIRSFHVWNYNEPAGSGHGIKDVDIHYSTTNSKATDHLLGAYVFAKAPEVGKEHLGEDFVANFQARYIKLDINSNWDGNDFAYGLAEIRFNGKPIEP